MDLPRHALVMLAATATALNLFVASVSAIVVSDTAANGHNDPQYIVDQAGGVLTGVVRLDIAYGTELLWFPKTDTDPTCTGTLLSDGQHILTAAHCLRLTGGAYAQQIRVVFTMPTQNGVINFEGGGALNPINNLPVADGNRIFATTDFVTRQQFDPSDASSGYDIGVIKLPKAAPEDAQRHDLYRDSNELDLILSTAGYGRTGNGNGGASIAPDGKLRTGSNRIEDLGNVVAAVGPNQEGIIFQGPQDTMLVWDFDNGLAAQDAFEVHYNYPADTGLGMNLEVDIAKGDSGRPTFIGTLIAGVHSHVSWTRSSRLPPTSMAAGSPRTAASVSSDSIPTCRRSRIGSIAPCPSRQVGCWPPSGSSRWSSATDAAEPGRYQRKIAAKNTKRIFTGP